MSFAQKILLFCITAFLAAQIPLKAQFLDAGNLISELTLERQVAFLADTLCEGRASFTRGGAEAAFWIGREFGRLGLKPFGASFYKSFPADGKVGHNVVGLLRGSRSYSPGKYIIIAAHYDHLGVLAGKLYPGADSNASGVAAMLSLAKMFSFLRSYGKAYSCSFIFVGLDAKQASMAGSKSLYDALSRGRLVDPVTGTPVKPSQIAMMVNLDILGGVSSPVTPGRKDYLLMLGGSQRDCNALSLSNIASGTGLQLCYDYYGSKDFTDLFLNRVSDQKAFRDHGIPSVMFTSGITMQTNRTNDDMSAVDFPILRKRISLIFNWLESLAR